MKSGSSSFNFLSHPLDGIVFDCDGTLTKIEGVDQLAKYNNVFEPVQFLTKKAMESDGLHPDLYEERLHLIQPTEKNIQDLSLDYIAHVSCNAKQVIQIFHNLGKAIYVISAGILQGVRPFTSWLGIEPSRVFAVSVEFDSQGRYLDFDRGSPLIHNHGKCQILEQIKKQHPRLLFMGDGMNDLATKPYVERFVGYGGAFPRPKMEKEEPFFIPVDDFLRLLPFSFTEYEKKHFFSL